MSDKKLIASLGLGYEVVQNTEGRLAEEKFPDILKTLANKDVLIATKIQICNDLRYWGGVCPARESAIRKSKDEIFEIILQIAQYPDDDDPTDKNNYSGHQSYLHTFIQTIESAKQMESTQKLAGELAPLQYFVAETLLKAKVTLIQSSPFRSACAGISRVEIMKCLLLVPYQGNCNIPNAMKVISQICLDSNHPKDLKEYAKQQLSSLLNVNKDNMKHCGEEFMQIIETSDSGSDHLISYFSTLSEMYTLNPSCLHNRLSLLFTMNFSYTCSVLYTISQKNPQVLIPHAKDLFHKAQTESAMAYLCLLCLKDIASVSPDTIYPMMDDIIVIGKNLPNASYCLAGLCSHCSKSKSPANASEIMFLKLIELLKNSTDPTYVPTVLAEISNTMHQLPSLELLKDNLSLILKYRSSNEIIVQAISDFAAGRSLEALANRIDEINSKVASCCNNFEDVIAYVDANMKDIKDFLGEVVKKLPNPKRLEVVGTLRKAFVLHFECAHSGYEYQIVSYDWSKWLKMGFSLMKAGKLVIDIGMGNPLALIATGIDCVRGIYEAYKMNDDDEFNTYITNPFLTSTEQDGLIEKLRSSHFFDKFSYDSQVAGWYLIDHAKDGTPPEADAGTITKVRSKEGYGIGETIKASMQGIATTVCGDVIGDDTVATSAIDALPTNLPTLRNKNKNEEKTDTNDTNIKSMTVVSGGRAAEMKTQLLASGTLTTTSRNDNNDNYSNSNGISSAKVLKLENEMMLLVAKMTQLENDVAILKSQQNPSSVCCTVS